MDKLVVICGPTATGKTALALKLCKKISAKGGPAPGWAGEIISADSRQVYKGMDIGTGKEMSNFTLRQAQGDVERSRGVKSQISKLDEGWIVDGIPIYLYDVVEPDEDFSVAHFVALASKRLTQIWGKRKLPFVVGGTGFYIKALLDGIETIGVPPDKELRGKLEKEVEEKGLESLVERLKKLDPKRASEIDTKNPRRVIRALEIAAKSKKLKGKSKKKILNSQFSILNSLFIGLTMPRKLLYERIDKRADKMIKAGLIEEIKRLLKEGYSWDLPSMSAVGYRQFRPYFEEKATLEECLQQKKYDEHNFARRQITWFKRDKRINWFDVTKPNFDKRIEELIKWWLEETEKLKNQETEKQRSS